MKRLQVNEKPTIRETQSEYRGRPLILSLSAFTLRIGEKGRRRSKDYEVSVEGLYRYAAELKARRDRAEKKIQQEEKRKAKKYR